MNVAFSKECSGITEKHSIRVSPVTKSACYIIFQQLSLNSHDIHNNYNYIHPEFLLEEAFLLIMEALLQ